ncbi:unnamed protein product [Phytophthora lilii]|uniref:Unnamed protein product n=1 Tax=Phytophthora lilii TaxID=2077276 RepID=A0A9W6TNM7_9STRA|nr:unnamed protein product [Phytophthora lilii]
MLIESDRFLDRQQRHLKPVAQLRQQQCTVDLCKTKLGVSLNRQAEIAADNGQQNCHEIRSYFATICGRYLPVRNHPGRQAGQTHYHDTPKGLFLNTLLPENAKLRFFHPPRCAGVTDSRMDDAVAILKRTSCLWVAKAGHFRARVCSHGQQLGPKDCTQSRRRRSHSLVVAVAAAVAAAAAAAAAALSMGGMIATELAATAPQRVRSLTLLVTTRGAYLPHPRMWRPFLGSVLGGSMNCVMELLYPSAILDRPIDGREDLTVQDVLNAYHSTPQSTNAYPPLYALAAQGVACLTHYVSDERLESVAKAGFPILIIGSKQDILIPPENSVALIERLQGDHVRTLFFETGGHGAFFQFADEIADGLAQTIQRAKL